MSNKVVYPETVNERLNAELAYGKYPDFLPTELIRKRKDANIECHADGMTPLSDYFGQAVDRRTFLSVALRLVQIVKRCEENRISPNNIDLEKDRIFIDPMSGAVKCVYWPVVNNQRAEPPQTFFAAMPCDINFTSLEDNSYLRRYGEFFVGLKPFSINAFERLLHELLGEAPTGEQATTGSFTPGGDGARTEDFGVHPTGDAEYDPFNPIPPVDRQPPSNIPQPHLYDDDSHISPPIDPYAGRGTVIMEAVPQGTGFRLIRLRTNEVIPIVKSEFTIGSDPHCDYVISDNTFISRRHAVVVRYDTYCCIADNNSTNKTTVAGTVLRPKTETRLTYGMKISLANEEFVYYT